MLLDQNASRGERVFVNFLGRPAATNFGLAMLALKSGAPVVPAFSARDAAGRHRGWIGPPIPPAAEGERGRAHRGHHRPLHRGDRGLGPQPPRAVVLGARPLEAQPGPGRGGLRPVSLAETLQRRRVALGWLFGAAFLVFARPTPASVAAGPARRRRRRRHAHLGRGAHPQARGPRGDRAVRPHAQPPLLRQLPHGLRRPRHGAQPLARRAAARGRRAGVRASSSAGRSGCSRGSSARTTPRTRARCRGSSRGCARPPGRAGGSTGRWCAATASGARGRGARPSRCCCSHAGTGRGGGERRRRSRPPSPGFLERLRLLLWMSRALGRACALRRRRRGRRRAQHPGRGALRDGAVDGLRARAVRDGRPARRRGAGSRRRCGPRRARRPRAASRPPRPGCAPTSRAASNWRRGAAAGGRPDLPANWSAPSSGAPPSGSRIGPRAASSRGASLRAGALLLAAALVPLAALAAHRRHPGHRGARPRRPAGLLAARPAELRRRARGRPRRPRLGPRRARAHRRGASRGRARRLRGGDGGGRRRDGARRRTAPGPGASSPSPATSATARSPAAARAAGTRCAPPTRRRPGTSR